MAQGKERDDKQIEDEVVSSMYIIATTTYVTTKVLESDIGECHTALGSFCPAIRAMLDTNMV